MAKEFKKLDKAKEAINTFYRDRKLTLRYSREGDHDILYDNRIAFVGTLTEDKKSPADGKAIIFYQAEKFPMVF